MSNNKISDIETLELQISQLKAKKTEYEEELRQSFDLLTQQLINPVYKNTSIENDENNHYKRHFINFSKIVINMGTDYLIEQNFGKKQNLGEFLTNSALRLISIPFIKNGFIQFFSEISNTETEY